MYSTQYYDTEKYVYEISTTDADFGGGIKGVKSIELKFQNIECGKGSMNVKAGDLSIQESIVPRDAGVYN